MISFLKRLLALFRNTPTKSFKRYCKENPEAPACRIYDV